MPPLRRLLPSLNGLVAFEAAVRCGTFAGAASELGVTGPAVSRTIGRVEAQLGAQLFDRTPRGVQLTADGAELFAAVTKGFGEIERALSRISRPRNAGRKPILLSVSSAFATHWLMPRLGAFHERFPGQEIQLQLMSGPMRGPVDGVDLAMRYDHAPEDGHTVLPLMEELLIPVCAPHFAREGVDGLEVEQSLRMITLREAQPDWGVIFSPASGRSEAEQLSLADYSLVVQAALVGQGIALGWLNTVSLLLAQGKLVPAARSVIRTGRCCEFVIGTSDKRAVLHEIHHWIAAEMAKDIAAIRSRYPELGDLHAG
ncbi:transcriptional regulator [Alsobacter metallidurans]|uniref:Transcriptional regulator n=1 Tax=Alsobacter metallidurans TaxID=340221 RepID=A0A917I8Q2_9HYPH|nr:LysR family transcriptional regulator [Alsobacter metallidurans]GGH23853.1 transcriptional regulator [Alsobacter metallidurans]